MQTSLKISTPTPEHQDDWEKLYRGYADFYRVEMNDTILATVWSWITDDSNPFYCLVAHDGSELVGLMHFRAMPSPLRGTMVGFLDDLFVKPESRGTGAVDALFEALDKERQAHGWSLVRWITADDNYRARGVYDKRSIRTHWITYQLDD